MMHLLVLTLFVLASQFFWVLVFEAIRSFSASSGDGVAFVGNVGGFKVAIRDWSAAFASVSTVSAMETVLVTVLVIAIIVLLAVTFNASVIWL